jgi:hypothetical protein
MRINMANANITTAIILVLIECFFNLPGIAANIADSVFTPTKKPRSKYRGLLK